MWQKMQRVENPFVKKTRSERKKAIRKIYSTNKKLMKENPHLPRPTLKDAKELYKNSCSEVWYANDIYQAAVDYSAWENVDANKPGRCIWLSIKNHEKTTEIPWQHKQWIKNDICGEEMEAMELFPAESRLVNTANQYHLWVFDQIPIGFNGRLISSLSPGGTGKQTLEKRE